MISLNLFETADLTVIDPTLESSGGPGDANPDGIGLEHDPDGGHSPTAVVDRPRCYPASACQRCQSPPPNRSPIIRADGGIGVSGFRGADSPLMHSGVVLVPGVLQGQLPVSTCWEWHLRGGITSPHLSHVVSFEQSERARALDGQ
jgi:hypothetical protein